ncbi:ribonuclease D [Thermodesulfobacteriota bacterium]
MNSNYEIIDTKSGVKAVARSFEKEKAIAVDLEADSMYHFKERVCLIQMATKTRSVVIDPLQVKEISSLKPLFANRDIQKIFHGADYDIRSLYRDFKIRVNNLFDTELASRFLGIRETGLEAMLKNFFNIDLNKKYQKKDWSKRPLPREMIDYAARDTIHLIPLFEILKNKLNRKGRLSWVTEECKYLSNVRPSTTDNQPLFLKFKGAGRLRPRSLAVLESILQFRKKVAAQKDRPLFKIFGNESVMKIAVAKPATLRRLKGVKALSKKQLVMYGSDLVEAVDNALKLHENSLPVYPRMRTPVLSRRVPARVKALKSWRDKKARDLDIDPALICNKAMIAAIAVQKPHDMSGFEAIENMKNWQKRTFGQEILAVLKR